MVALCKMQTVNLNRLAIACESEAKSASVLRRIQRFLSSYVLDKDLVAGFIFRLLPHKPPYRLAMDRTSWEVKKEEINILVLSVIYQGLSFPILFSTRKGKGNSSWQQRKALMDRFILLFGKESIEYVTADREFIGIRWMRYLREEKIDFYLRMKGCYRVITSTGHSMRIDRLFSFLQVNECHSFKRCFSQGNTKYYLTGTRVKGKNGQAELVVIASREKTKAALELYRTRWQIETSFKALKSSGFNLEDTRIKEKERIENLFALLCMSFAWSYAIGVYVSTYIEPIRMLNTGRRAYSIFKYGLNYLCRYLLSDYKLDNYDPIKFLSCT